MTVAPAQGRPLVARKADEPSNGADVPDAVPQLPTPVVPRMYIDFRVVLLSKRGCLGSTPESRDGRDPLKRFIERSFPDTAVLSYNEIVPQVKVSSIGMISLD